jgi:hypothetical protein
LNWNPADGDRLIRTGSAEQLLGGIGHGRNMVADLEPQATEQLQGLVHGQGPAGHVPLVVLVENLVQSSQAHADIRVFQMNADPADPDRGQRFPEAARRVLRYVLVDLRQAEQFLAFGGVARRSGQPPRLAPEGVRIRHDPLDDLDHGAVEVLRRSVCRRVHP